MKNKSISRERFNEMTVSMCDTLVSLVNSTHLTDDEVYDMTMRLMKSYVTAIVPTKEEN